MTQLAVWLFICLAAAWMLRRRPIAPAAGAIVLWVFVPAIAGYRLTGVATGPLGAHPATWLVLCAFGVQILTNPRLIGRVFGRHPFVVLVVAVFTLGAGLMSALSGSGGQRLLMDQIIGPFVLWLLVVAGAFGDVSRLLVLRNVVLVSAATQCVIALVQFRVGAVVFYEQDYARLPWFDPERFDRWMGTADGPLVLALLLCVAAGLSLSLQRGVIRVPLLMLFLVGTLIAQARTGTAVLCLLLVYAVLRPAMAVWARALTSATIGTAGYLVLTSGLVSGLAGRIANDTGSSAARLRALQFAFDTAGSYLGVGRGLTSSYDVARNAGLQTSLESSLLMYVVDVGAVLAVLYFGLQIVLLVAYGRHGHLPGATVAALAAVGLQHLFSAVAGANLTGTLIWAALAIVVAGSHRAVLPNGQPGNARAPAELSWSARARESASTSAAS